MHIVGNNVMIIPKMTSHKTCFRYSLYITLFTFRKKVDKISGTT